jgi:carbonic anhydrase/acetyltransferase-like protein (isoleucine patch superfamily)
VIGENSQVQDNSVINPSGKNTLIGTGVMIGSNCWVGHCIIKDGAHIASNATINNGCVVEEGAFVAAGAVVSQDTTVPANEVFYLYDKFRFGPAALLNF